MAISIDIDEVAINGGHEIGGILGLGVEGAGVEVKTNEAESK